MASLKAMVASANKLASSDDFEGALNMCEQGIQTTEGSKFFPLVSMHGFCAMSLGKYVKAEKSFLAAKLLDANPQMLQKNTKFLADTYEKLEKWQEHARELTLLYHIAKDKGNIDRASSLSTQITASFEKCRNFNAAGLLLVDHLNFLADTGGDTSASSSNSHIRSSFTLFHSLKMANLAAYEDKKSAKTSIGTQEVVAEASIFDKDLLSNDALYQLALRCLQELKEQLLSGAEDGLVLAGPLLSLLRSHLEALRKEVFSPPTVSPIPNTATGGRKDNMKMTAPPPRVTYGDIFELAHEIFDSVHSFFAPAMTTAPEQCSLSCSSFLQICQIVIEAWFFSPKESYDTIATVVDFGYNVAVTYSSVDSSFSGPIVAFMTSANILHCISTGDKAKAVLLAKRAAPYWVSSIQRHQNVVSSSRRDTMKTPTSSFQITTSVMEQSSEAVVSTLCLCVAVSLGALGGFRGDIFHDQLNLSDALYMTQEVSSRVLCLKKILLALEHSSFDMQQESDNMALTDEGTNSVVATFTRGKLRQIILELVPLGRTRILVQIQQVEAAFGLCCDQEWLLGIPSSITLEEGSTERLRVNDEVVSSMLPLSQWVFIHTVVGGSGLSCGSNLSEDDRRELVRAIDFIFSSGCCELFMPLLQVEKEWLLLLLLLEDESETTFKAEFSFTANLLRENNINEHSISTFISKLQDMSSASSSPYWTGYSAELVHFRIGIAMWLGKQTYRGDKTKCLAQLIKTAKQNPQFGSVYSFIGHYYLLVLKDPARATKCYIKALAYDPMDVEAGISLSQIYIEGGDVSKVHKLWSDVNVLTVSHAYWCFSLSGQFNICQKDYESSVRDFQKSLELWNQDLIAWYSLCACYSSLGQNVAASKSLTCALEIIAKKNSSQQRRWESMRVVLICELAEVERRMGSFQDAFSHFLEVRELATPSESTTDSSIYVLALKGIGEVCLALGHERLTCGWSRGACTIVTQGIDAMSTVLGMYPSTTDDNENVLACLLKLKGDLCAFCRHFSPADYETIMTTGCSEFSFASISSRLEEAEQSYRKLLVISQRQIEKCSGNEIEILANDQLADVVSAWCDIGSSLFFQASLELASRGQGSGIFSTKSLLSDTDSPAVRFLRQAMEAFVQGLLLLPDHSGCWNGAGLCCHLDDSLRELCLARSTVPKVGESPYPAGFANLSSLYLSHNMQTCAKECLSSLQLLETNPLHWLVLGGLLEKSGPDEKTKKSHQQSVLDAYIAALEVSKPVEGLLGIAVSYMKLHGFLSETGALMWSNHDSWPLRTDRVALRYAVEQPVGAFLYRRPLHPFAWSLLAWAYVQRQAWHLAAGAYKSLLQAMELVLTRCGKRVLGNEYEEKQHYVQNITSLASSAIEGIQLCKRMSDQLDCSPVSGSDYPAIEEVSPHFISFSSRQSSLSKENVMMAAFMEQSIDKCCALLQTRQTEILSSVQAHDVSDFLRIRHWVRWMQMVDYFSQHCVGNDRKQMLSCLVPVGRLLCDGGIDGNDGDAAGGHQRSYILNAFRVYAEGFLQVGQALLHLDGASNSGLREMAVTVLDLGLSLHPRHDAMLRMLGRADHTQLESSATASLNITRLMLVSSCTDENTLANELKKRHTLCTDFIEPPASQDNEDSMCNERNKNVCVECVCCQQRIDHGEELLGAYSDSVALHCGYKVKSGRRFSKKDRKDILTAIWMDPGNLTTWAALAGGIFSDVTLGPKCFGEYGSELEKAEVESKGDEDSAVLPTIAKCSDQDEIGVFSDSELVKTCVDIMVCLRSQSDSSFIDSLVPGDVAASLFYDWRLFNTNEECLRTSIVAEVALCDVFKLLSEARALFCAGSCKECVSLYEKVIHELTIINTHKSVLSRVLIELGNVYSFLCRPEEACTQYRTSAVVAASQDTPPVASFVSLCCAVAYARKAATGGNHQDVTTAREFAEEASVRGAGFPSHTATAHLTTGLIWLGLSKPNKVTQEVSAAKAVYELVDVPY